MASLQSDPVDPPKSIRVLYGQTIIQQYHESKGIGEHTPLPTTPTMNVPADNALIAPICIIGAGVAGLYAAMMLDYLDLRYEVLEASERVGGRLFTKSLGNNAYDYFVSIFFSLTDLLLK
jgi:NADPH-dependent 2,4-dienoyl-CoA reductase/sulfur reductase-like enzyme